MDTKREEGKKLLADFEQMRNESELKALSKASLERELTEEEFKRMKQLFNAH